MSMEAIKTPDGLTKAQAAVYTHITLGMTAKESAEQLGCALKTAENHRYAMFRKLGHKTALGLAVWHYRTFLPSLVRGEV